MRELLGMDFPDRIPTRMHSGPDFCLLSDGAVYLSDRIESERHSHPIFQISFAVGQSVLHFETEPASPWGLISPNTPHAVLGEGRALSFFVDAEGPRGRVLRTLLAQGRRLSAHQHRFRAGLPECPRPQLYKAFFDEVTAGVPPMEFDSRVERALALLRVAGEPPSLGELADQAGLSESRFRRLFRQEIGVPLRTYRLWLRAVVAILHIDAGSEPTAAAYKAGFADGSHLSRTHRRFWSRTVGSFAKALDE